ncbi:MAG: lysophospholipid acyltransferase family protein [Candidatus Omnitrophica bacterium]|nr:lysophospholipid acyltransferase family protein [Candidatus Omnitrophota bacterium]
MVIYFLYKLGRWLAMILPLPLAYKAGIFLSGIKYFFSKKEREAVKNNLKVILGQNDLVVKTLPWKIYTNFGRYLVDFFRAEKLNKEFTDKFVKIEGLENMDAALAQGKGAIGLTAHLGNWELCAQIMAILGYKINAIALNHTNKHIDEFFNHQRTVSGVKVIPVGLSVRSCFSALKRNEIVGILGDRDFSGEHGMFVDFFGKSLLAPRGPALLSLRTGAAIVPAFVIREEKDARYFRYVFNKPIFPKRTSDEAADIKILTEEYIHVIEQYVKQYPLQWFMFREFWKAEKVEIL